MKGSWLSIDVCGSRGWGRHGGHAFSKQVGGIDDKILSVGKQGSLGS